MNRRQKELPYTLPEKIRDLMEVFEFAINKKNTSAVIIVDGRSGMGKTTLANQIAKYIDGDFGLHKLHYNPTTFKSGGNGKIGLEQAKQGDVILFDEAMQLSSRASLTEINRAIVIAMSMIRSKNIVVIFCINSIFDLDRNLALHRADLLLSVYGESLTRRGRVMAFFKGLDGMDRIKKLYIYGKKTYDYNRPKSNFFTTFSSHFVLDENQYEKEKQVEVNRILRGDSTRRLKSMIIQDRLLIWIKENHPDVSIDSLAEISGLTTRSIYNVFQRNNERGLQNNEI